VAALGCVDYVTVFDEDTPIELIRQVRPQVLAKRFAALLATRSASSLVVAGGLDLQAAKPPRKSTRH
jgi:bifunctional ADP-heptose synthase (sugar kinase/adenylyltransferase)